MSLQVGNIACGAADAEVSELVPGELLILMLGAPKGLGVLRRAHDDAELLQLCPSGHEGFHLLWACSFDSAGQEMTLLAEAGMGRGADSSWPGSAPPIADILYGGGGGGGDWPAERNCGENMADCASWYLQLVSAKLGTSDCWT